MHLALTAARNSPGRPVCLVDFDLQKGDLRAYMDTPYRRSVVDLVEVADEISVRHLQETLYTHRDSVRLLLAPDDGERAEEVNSMVARNVLGAVRSRHALTVVDLGANVSEASAIGAEMASKVLDRGHGRRRRPARRAPPARPVAAAAGARGRPGDARAAQPGLAQARGPAGPGAQGGRRAARRDDDPGGLRRARGGREHGLAGAAGGPEAARGGFEALANELEALPSPEDPGGGEGESRGLLARLSGERGQTSVEFAGSCSCC